MVIKNQICHVASLRLCMNDSSDGKANRFCHVCVTSPISMVIYDIFIPLGRLIQNGYLWFEKREHKGVSEWALTNSIRCLPKTDATWALSAPNFTKYDADLVSYWYLWTVICGEWNNLFHWCLQSFENYFSQSQSFKNHFSQSQSFKTYFIQLLHKQLHPITILQELL